MSNEKVKRFSRVDWINNLPPIMPTSSSTFCGSPSILCPSPSPRPFFRSLSPSQNRNKCQQINPDWDFLISPDHSFSPRKYLSPPSEELEYRIFFQSPHHSYLNLATILKSASILQPNAHLIQNQAYKQGIIPSSIFSYLAYTVPCPYSVFYQKLYHEILWSLKAFKKLSALKI